MDIKKIIENIVEELQKDDNLMERFEKEPVKLIESIVEMDLPDEIVEKVVDGVKAKIAFDKVDDALDKVSGIAGALKKLF